MQSEFLQKQKQQSPTETAQLLLFCLASANQISTS